MVRTYIKLGDRTIDFQSAIVWLFYILVGIAISYLIYSTFFKTSELFKKDKDIVKQKI